MASPYLQNGKKIRIKKEARSSIYDSEATSDVFTPPRMRSVDTPLTPMSQQTGFDQNSEHSRTPIDNQTKKDNLKARLTAKSRAIKIAQNVLNGFKDWLAPEVTTLPEVGDWIDAINALEEHGEIPKVLLGFMGSSGSGKSSLINALLEEERLLPCSTMKACTAVAVEVGWNPNSDKSKAYLAEVEFITADEWKVELDILIAELLPLTATERLNPSEEDAKVAAAKIQAVYPDLAISKLTASSVAQLMHNLAVSKVLGTTKSIERAVDEGEGFAATIKPYIRSNLKPTKGIENFCYWPLVKSVRIFTRSPVLSTGLVIVDLPGSGDSNAARVKVAQNYMQRVAAICIVDKIERALTSAATKDLFDKGGQLKRRLLRSGHLDDHRTFFVLTATDSITNTDFIDEQNLHDDPTVIEINEMERAICTRKDRLPTDRKECMIRKRQLEASAKEVLKQITLLQAARKQSNPQAIKRKRDENEPQSSASNSNSEFVDLQRKYRQIKKSIENCRKEIENLDQEEKGLVTEKKRLMARLSAFCIRERNRVVADGMKSQFSASFSELGEVLKNEGDEVKSSSKLVSTSDWQNDVQVFCVCSQVYQQFHGRLTKEDESVGFESAEDTFMPQLLNFCKEFTLQARERLADEYLEDLIRLRTRMRGWANNTIPDKEITDREKGWLNEAFIKQSNSAIEAVSEIIHSAITQLQDDMYILGPTPMEAAASAAKKHASFVFKKWCRDIMHHGTWRAICTRNGNSYKTKRMEGAPHRWNEDLAEELTRNLDKSLRMLVTAVLPALCKEYIAKIEKCIVEFSTSLRESSLGVTQFIANPLQNLTHNTDQLRANMLRSIESRFEEAISKNREVHLKIPLRIEIEMKPSYFVAASVKGSGALQKMKDIIEHHIKENGLSMYAAAGKEVADTVTDSATLLRHHLESDFNDYMNDVEKNFKKMLTLARETPRPERGPAKIKLQREVLVKLHHFDELLNDSKLKNDAPSAAHNSVNEEVEDECDEHNSEINFGENESDDLDNLDNLNDLEDVCSDISNLDGPDSSAERFSLNDYYV